jgi:hypothetical protein
MLALVERIHIFHRELAINSCVTIILDKPRPVGVLARDHCLPASLILGCQKAAKRLARSTQRYGIFYVDFLFYGADLELPSIRPHDARSGI